MKHDHHTAPRYYLKAFGIPDNPAYVWEYQRGKGYKPGPPGRNNNPVKRSLKKASVKTDYYGHYEDTLERLEEDATPIIERLRTTRSFTAKPLLTLAEKERLTDYIGLFMKRIPAREERLPGIWKAVQAEELPKLEQLGRQLMDEGRFTDASKLEQERHKYEGSMPEELRQRSTITPFDMVRTRIINLQWTFLTVATPMFLTSDNPVRYSEREGLGHDLAFLTFPICTNMTLLACTATFSKSFELPTADTDCGAARANEHHAKILNHLTITGAHQYLYSHEANEQTVFNFG